MHRELLWPRSGWWYRSQHRALERTSAGPRRQAGPGQRRKTHGAWVACSRPRHFRFLHGVGRPAGGLGKASPRLPPPWRDRRRPRWHGVLQTPGPFENNRQAREELQCAPGLDSARQVENTFLIELPSERRGAVIDEQEIYRGGNGGAPTRRGL